MKDSVRPTSPLLRNRWFGKAVAGVIALSFSATDWPLTLLITGIAVLFGHLFDLWASGSASWPWQRRRARSGDPTAVFLFMALGRLAKTGGPVLPAHIALTESLMTDLAFDQDQRRRAIDWFNAGKASGPELEALARRCQPQWRNAPAIRDYTLRTLARALLIRRDLRAEATLISLAMLLGTGPVDLQRLLLALREDTGKHGEDRPGSRSQALAALDLPATASATEIRQAYRRLVARYHPDRLSTDATRSERDYHHQRMREIRDAYETLTKPD